MQPQDAQYVQPVQYPAQPGMQQVVQQPVVMAQPTAVMTTAGNKPDVLVAYLLWFFLGFLGVHHLYVGRGVGIFLVALITLQGFGFWWLADLFLIPGSCSKMRGGMVVVR